MDRFNEKAITRNVLNNRLLVEVGRLIGDCKKGKYPKGVEEADREEFEKMLGLWKEGVLKNEFGIEAIELALRDIEEMRLGKTL